MSTTSNNKKIKETLEGILKKFIEEFVAAEYLDLGETIENFKYDINIDEIILKLTYLRDALNELTNLDFFNMKIFLLNKKRFCNNKLSDNYLNRVNIKYAVIKNKYIKYNNTFCSVRFNEIIKILKRWHELKLSESGTLQSMQPLTSVVPRGLGRFESMSESQRGTPQSIQTLISVPSVPSVPRGTQEIKRPKIGFLRSLFTGSKVTPLNQEMEPKTSAYKRFMSILGRRNKVDSFNGIVGGLVKKIPKKKNMQKKKNQPTVVVGGLVKKNTTKKNVQKKKNQSSTVRGLVKKIPQKKNAKKNRNQG